MALLDQRLNAFRADLADERLKGRVAAENFVSGHTRAVSSQFANLHSKPSEDSGVMAQVLHGHDVYIFEEVNGWAWLQSAEDGYVGYTKAEHLKERTEKPTHMVFAPRTFLYREADLKSPRSDCLSMGSKLSVVGAETRRGTDYQILDDGRAVISKHLMPIGNWSADYVQVAETLLHTPYLWGGNTGFGIDCSGLVSLAFMLCGKTVLRDSDMQADAIGEILVTDENFSNLQRGDLVFWKGHVGIMTNPIMLLHANGNSMDVRLEEFQLARQRISVRIGNGGHMGS